MSENSTWGLLGFYGLSGEYVDFEVVLEARV